MFGKIGKFLKKNIVDPVDKAVFRPIDKAIIKPIDKAIIQPIDKAIIQPIDKAIIQPIDKAIIQPIDKAIIQPIDKAIIQPIDNAIIDPIREATDKGYALRHEHKKIETLRARNAELRPQFFQSQQNLAVAQSEYERVSEDFTKTHGATALQKYFGGGAGIAAQVDPNVGIPDVVKAVQDGSRFILKTVSLGLSEALFNIDEIPRERKLLERKISDLSDESRQLASSTRQIRQAVKQFNAATEEIKAQHAKLGADVTASDVHVISARKSAQIEIINRLFAEELSHEDIVGMTGFAPELIAEAAQNSTLRKDA